MDNQREPPRHREPKQPTFLSAVPLALIALVGTAIGSGWGQTARLVIVIAAIAAAIMLVGPVDSPAATGMTKISEVVQVLK